MKAVTWRGVNDIGVEDVPEPALLNGHDIIIEVGLSATCGSDLHLVGGYIPAMRAGDVLGHEFMGRVVEVGTVEVGAVVPGALELGLLKELASWCCNNNRDVTYMHCE